METLPGVLKISMYYNWILPTTYMYRLRYNIWLSRLTADIYKTNVLSNSFYGNTYQRDTKLRQRKKTNSNIKTIRNEVVKYIKRNKVDRQDKKKKNVKVSRQKIEMKEQ